MRGPPGTRSSPRVLLAAALAGTLLSAGFAGALQAAPLAADPAVAGGRSGGAFDPGPDGPARGEDDDPNARAPDTADAPAGETRAPDEETAAALPARPLDPQETAVLERLKDPRPLLPRLPAKTREGFLVLYGIADFKPIWIADGRFTPAADAVIARMRAAGEDGLDPRAYPIPTLRPGMSEAALAEADLGLSGAVVLYARDARGGRVDLPAISKLITPDLDLPAPESVLGQLAVSGEQAGERLQAYNPNQPGYLALKRRLAALHGPVAAPARPPLRLPNGPVLRVGMSDPRVPALRAHFGLPERSPSLDAGPGEPDAYDKPVAEAVAAFQRTRGLPDDGVLTRSTFVALAQPPAPPGARSGDEAELIANMERWRWLPRELGDDYILVNVPEYRLRVYRGGTLRDETRVIVGRTETPTPLFSGAMEVAVVNPYWYVPPSIQKTMRGTGGFEVVGRGKTMGLRQPPGPRNALGYIKFLFPNRHAVYLHDTPARHLFAAAQRAFSHGCVRVDDPFRLADAVLPDTWTKERLTKLIGQGERTIRLDHKLPVHLAYFTAYVDDAGVYRTIPDVYGYDARIRAALGLTGTGGQMAALPAEPPRTTTRIAEPAAPPARARPAARAAAPVRHAVRRVRRDYSGGYGEPGLWTPPPASYRTWW